MGIPAERALAFVVLIHAVTLLLTSVGGAVALSAAARRRTVGTAAPAVADDLVVDTDG